jgi:hypothetical protein
VAASCTLLLPEDQPSTEAALAASALAEAGWGVDSVGLDAGRPEEWFRDELARRAPAAVMVVARGETREIEARALLLAEMAGIPRRAWVGDALRRVPPEAPPGVLVLAGDPVEGVGRFAGCRLDPRRIAPAPWSRVDPRPGRATPLFRELHTIGLLAARTDPLELAPTAALAALDAPLLSGPRDLHPEAALAQLRTREPQVDHAVLLDRDAGDAVLTLLPLVAEEVARVSVRVSAARQHPSLHRELRARGATRVVFEIDRIRGEEPLAGSTAAVEDLPPHVDAARAAGLEVGVVWVLGLPGETAAQARTRTAWLRRLAPEHLAPVPYEATSGHPAERRLHAEGLLPCPEEPWIREVHHPLRQACFGAEEFQAAWAAALELSASVQAGAA